MAINFHKYTAAGNDFILIDDRDAMQRHQNEANNFYSKPNIEKYCDRRFGVGADGLIKFPDFRSGERTFQLLTQVAGRAGRKHEQGRVQIQAFDPDHPIIKEVLKGDYKAFAERELKERFEFKYPPFYRLIQISIRHKDPEKVKIAAAFFGRTLREKLGERVLGPVIPNIARVRSYFGQDILVKLEKSTSVISAAKNLIKHTSELAIGKTGFSQLIVVIDVDPM